MGDKVGDRTESPTCADHGSLTFNLWRLAATTVPNEGIAAFVPPDTLCRGKIPVHYGL